MNCKPLQNENGFALTALLTVFGVFAIIMTLAVVLLPLSQNETTATNRETAAKKSMYIAEAGLNDYVWNLNRNGADYVHNTIHPAQGNGIWLSYEDGDYHLDVTEDSSTGNFIVTSTGRVIQNDITTTRKIRAVIAARSFTRFIWYSTFEKVDTGNDSDTSSNNFIYFASQSDGTHDILRGIVCSADRIHIYGKPEFQRQVITEQTIDLTNMEDNGQSWDLWSPEGFLEGQDIPDLPPSNTGLALWANPAYNDGRNYFYRGETRITLNPWGTMDVECLGPLNEGLTGSNIPLPKSGVVFVDGLQPDINSIASSVPTAGSSVDNGDVFVSGTLKGRLTICAQNNIYITGNLKYSDQTFSDINSDMLGLVANNYVFVLHFWRNGFTPPDGSGGPDLCYATSYDLGSDTFSPSGVVEVAPNNITINAAIAALRHSFGFQSYGLQHQRGILSIKGSIIQNYRGAVGYIGSTGYSKDYDYDPRMMFRQPPHFIAPTDSGYEIVSWGESR